MKQAIAVLALGMWVQVAGADAPGSSWSERRLVEEKGELAELSDLLPYFYTGSELLEYCRVANEPDFSDVVQAGKCHGWIRGASDMHNILFALNGFEPQFCFPEGVTAGQMIAVVVKYLEENPAQLRRPAGPLTLNALVEAFPCE